MADRTIPTPAASPDVAEDYLVTAARTTLAASKTAEISGNPGDCARWWGRVEAALEALLRHVDEQAGR